MANPAPKLLIVQVSHSGHLPLPGSCSFAYGLPIGGYLLVAILRRKSGLRDCLPFVATLGLVAVLYLAYNWAQTGNPLLPPRLLNFGAIVSDPARGWILWTAHSGRWVGQHGRTVDSLSISLFRLAFLRKPGHHGASIFVKAR